MELGDADEDLMQHRILSGLTEDDYICQPQEDLEEGLPVAYNNASGFEETESMFNWDDEGLDDDWYMDETDFYWDETESEFFLDESMFDFEGEGDLTGFYNADEEDDEDFDFDMGDDGYVDVG